jgi:hypothetical protein
MPTIERTLKVLERCILEIQAYEAWKADLRGGSLDESGYEQGLKKYEDAIRAARREMIDALERYAREPERFVRHFNHLAEFHKGGSFEDSVFIMTKFPDSKYECANELQVVIDTVWQGVKKRGYVPRLASAANYQRWLWDNVELFLVGCARGIAIVEDKHMPELNPNVAMEWGWMTGMGKTVLFLREEGFSHDRADWSGLINEPFAWDMPLSGIEAALDKFLPSR